MQRWSILLVLALVTLFVVGCSPAAPQPEQKIAVPQAPPTQVPEETSDQPVQDIPKTVNTPAPKVQEFSMTAKKWEFIPETITANKGDTVRLEITSVDVKHGFDLPDFGVSEELEPGETVTVEFVADKTGTFEFYCSVYCGSGHSEMEGKLIVVE